MPSWKQGDLLQVGTRGRSSELVTSSHPGFQDVPEIEEVFASVEVRGCGGQCQRSGRESDQGEKGEASVFMNLAEDGAQIFHTFLAWFDSRFLNKSMLARLDLGTYSETTFEPNLTLLKPLAALWLIWERCCCTADAL